MENKTKKTTKSTKKTSSTTKKANSTKSTTKKTPTTKKISSTKSTKAKTIKPVKKEIVKETKVSDTKLKEKQKEKNNTINIKYIAILAVLVILGIIFLVSKGNVLSAPKLDISYSNDKTIKLSNVKKGLIYESEITISNKTDKKLAYSVEWKDVTNKFKKQNQILYIIDTKEKDAAYLGDSQLPVTDFTIFDKVFINPNKEHKYTVYINFKGKPEDEKNSSFKGTLEFKQVDK